MEKGIKDEPAIGEVEGISWVSQWGTLSSGESHGEEPEWRRGSRAGYHMRGVTEQRHRGRSKRVVTGEEQIGENTRGQSQQGRARRV